MLCVTNNNDFELKDRYDGVDFVFPPGKTVAVTEDAARHIFGLGESDKKDALVRLGWANFSAQMEEAMKKLNNFAFNVVDDLTPGEVVETDPVEEQGTAPLQAAPLPETEPDGSVKGNGDAPKMGQLSSILDGGAGNNPLK